MRVARRVLEVATIGVALSCTPARGSLTPSSADTIGEAEIARMGVSTAYDVVVRARGNFLHSRGRESHDPRLRSIAADVYVDNTFYGGVATLRLIPASDIAEIRFFQGYEAQYRFGSGHMGGVIQVITKN